MKTINGGKTEILTLKVAAGTGNEEKPIIINDNSSVSAVNVRVYGSYPVVVKEIASYFSAYIG